MRRLLSEPPGQVMSTGQQPLAPARFELMKELGSGGFGTVYQAWDREASRLVALKVAHEARSRSLRRFKSEFLTLVDMSHDHVASLYELHQEGGAWFFTMEYVDGVPLDTYLVPQLESWLVATRPGRPGVMLGIDRHANGYDATVPDAAPPAVHDDAPAAAAEVAPRPRPITAVADFERVRRVFRQVAEALAWLHASGHLHRDIKPSNVLVTSEGLVKLVDFGLVTKVRAGEEEPIDALAGTPPFLAPELSLGHRPTPASDWYAVGVMLYLVLTGSLPYVARPGLAPTAPASYAPSDLCAGVPADLDRLCAALLAADPRERPDAGAVLAALAPRPGVRVDVPSAPAPRPFVGRRAEVRRLAAALRPDEALATCSHVTLVSGAPGVGKSRLVEHVVRGAFVASPPPLVLRSRCLERGSLRLRALDGAVDDLAAMLAARMPRDVERLLPAARADRAALMALFPVLVDSVVQAEPAPDLPAAELERVALAALAHTLAKVAAQRRVIVVVDDAQWADADSAPALAALAHVPIDWLVVHRPVEGARRAVVDALVDALGPAAARAHVTLAPPAAAEARHIAGLALVGS